MREKIKKWVPGYALLPLVIMLAVNWATYALTPLWTNKMVHYNLETPVDFWIPFVPIFVIPYILAYLQWIVGYWRVALVGKEYCYRIYFGEVLAKLFVCIIYIVLPTTMVRANVIQGDIFSDLVRELYRIDAPVNLFPSIHCLESWICYRASKNDQYFGKGYQRAMGIATAIVFLSTLFIKQHVLVDVVGAIVVSEAGAALVKAFMKGKHSGIGVLAKEK